MPQTNQITKRRVEMSDPLPFLDPSGKWIVPAEPDQITTAAVDYVRPDILDAYVADARKRWGTVTVGDLDAGPNGYNGPTHIPAQLDHELAGTTDAATYTSDELQQPQANFSTVTLRNARGAGGSALLGFVAAQSTAAAATAGTEVSSARVATAWAAWANSTSTSTQTNNIPSGVTVASLALWTASTGGVFQAATDVASQPFSSAGTYQSTLTDTQA